MWPTTKMHAVNKLYQNGLPIITPSGKTTEEIERHAFQGIAKLRDGVFGIRKLSQYHLILLPRDKWQAKQIVCFILLPTDQSNGY